MRAANLFIFFVSTVGTSLSGLAGQIVLYRYMQSAILVRHVATLKEFERLYEAILYFDPSFPAYV